MSTRMPTSVVALLVLMAAGAQARQTGPRAPAPRSDPPKTVDSSPFRNRAFAGTEFNAAALEQPGCPIGASIVGLARADRGITVSVKLANIGGAHLTRYVVGAWVITDDGTVRGTQRHESKRRIEAGTTRSVDVVLRGTEVLPGDTIVIAVQEAIGEGAPWRREAKDLEKEARAVAAP